MASLETTSVKSFCIVTGASRGIGRAIAIALSGKFSADSRTVLTGRSVDALKETQRLVQAAAPGIHCKFVVADHSDEENISSVFSEITKDVNPDEFQSSVYCMGKAARHMLFRTIALEEPGVRILNYDPGPVDTKMLKDMITNTASPDCKQMLENLETRQLLLQPDQTASRLLGILEKDEFESGAHISYSDEMARTASDMHQK